jgi:hypothetical protein
MLLQYLHSQHLQQLLAASSQASETVTLKSKV